MESALCEMCGSIGLYKGDDGFQYCTACGTQSQNFIDEDLADMAGAIDETGRRTFAFARQQNVERDEQDALLQKMLRGSQSNLDDIEDLSSARAKEDELLKILSQRPDQQEELEKVRHNLASQYSSAENVHIWTGTQQTYDASELPSRFAAHIREYYVDGVQKMLQMQCEALVQECGVTPLICGIVGPIWLRFVASTRVFQSSWADEAVLLADADFLKKREQQEAETGETKVEEPKKKKRNHKLRIKIPKSKAGLKLVTIWTEALKERIPLRITLAILFLACHIARENVLPTDIAEWATQGKLPYLTAFLKIQARRFIGPDLRTIHVSDLELKNLFRPLFMSNARMVEMLAAYVANRLKLELPPVNFHPISYRLLRDLGLEAGEVMSYLERLYEWYMPEGIWLSARGKAFSTRAYVMAMIIVTLKIMYNIDGHAHSSLYWPSLVTRLKTSTSRSRRAKFQSVLESIEKRLLENAMKTEPELKDYLQYCQEYIFPGMKLSVDEETVYGHLWKLFEDLSSKEVEEANTQSNQPKQGNRAGRAPTEHRSSESSGEEEEEEEAHESHYSMGSAEWSRAASVRKPSVSNQQEASGAPSENRVQAERYETGEISSAQEDYLRTQWARSNLLKAMAEEIKRGGFKLMAPSDSSSISDSSYPVFQMLEHKRKVKKHVYADYFVLLFACASVTELKANILHKCVQVIEDELWTLETRVLELTEETGSILTE